MATSTECVVLNNGVKMPICGLGTWQSAPEQVKTAVRTALDCGYRSIDTAYNYLNEEAIGEVINEYIKSGKVKREDLFITTKLANIYTRPEDVKTGIDASLKNLNLSYVDLYLIHAPLAFKKPDDPKDIHPMKDGKLAIESTDLCKVYQEMEKLVAEGKAKSIGVSNFNSEQITRILKVAKIKPVTNQVECNAHLQQKKLQEFLAKENIVITAYAPIGSPGKRPTGFTDFNKDDLVLLEDPVIKELATKHNRTTAQILLRNLIQRRIIVIPKSVTPSRIKQNFQVFDFELSSTEMESISKLDCGQRKFKLDGLQHIPDYPFNLEF